MWSTLKRPIIFQKSHNNVGLFFDLYNNNCYYFDMKKIDSYEINWETVSYGLGLSLEKTIKMFDDGRILGRLGEFLHEKNNNGQRQSENCTYDVKDDNEIKSEIRTITNNVSFASSKEVGYGRKVTEEGFNDKLNSIDRYILLDKRKILDGKIDAIEITKDDLNSLSLGKNKSISAKKFFKIYDRIK